MACDVFVSAFNSDYCEVLSLYAWVNLSQLFRSFVCSSFTVGRRRMWKSSNSAAIHLGKFCKSALISHMWTFVS